MKLPISDAVIPGTILTKDSCGNVSGSAFLDKIFFISNGVMLANVRDISGVDGSTLQNWVKRKWIPNPVNKKYSKDQLARILIINMLRKSILLERIDFLLHYINGELDDTSDDIISESALYDLICKASDKMIADELDMATAIETVTASYAEPHIGAKARLQRALAIILSCYFSSLLQNHAMSLFEKLEGADSIR